MNRSRSQSIAHRFSQRLFSSLALSLSLVTVTTTVTTQVVQAEGSRSLYPAGATGSRANIEWVDTVYGNLVKRRTLLKVFARQGENILVGSSAMGVPNGSNRGDILIFNPGIVTGQIGSETVNPTNASFRCSTQTGQGKINSRTEELAGPRAITGGGNASGYIPCYYTAPTTGIYDIIMYGPLGFNSTTIAGGPTGDINLTSTNNFSGSQNSTIAAWDVTVRSATASSTTDLNGRLFAYYYSLFTGANGRPLNFSLYPVTNDGYRYQVRLLGLDPNGFLTYGNQVGFFDADGQTPLYRDVLGQDGQVANPSGGVSLARPQYAMFINPLSSDSEMLSYLQAIGIDGNPAVTGIPSTPVPPMVSSVMFAGNVMGNASLIGTGGTFTFNSTAGIYEIVISRDGTNFDPTAPNNRVLRGVAANAGPQVVSWNGFDNNGVAFPVGDNYPARVKVHAGEYHFPLLDAENNPFGGPEIQLLNGTNPLGNSQIFYDDRGYRTSNGSIIGVPGTVLCGTGAPNPPASNPITGIASGLNVRQYGQNSNSGNNNSPCVGSFGDTKGLDLWTFSPSSTLNTPVTIVPTNPRLRLVKRMTAIHVQQPNGSYVVNPLTGFNDVTTGANAADDNASGWPTTPMPYLQGIFDKTQLPPTVSPKPGDQVEYTIYFLSDGGANAQGVNLCDYVPQNSTFVPGSIVKTFGTTAPTAVADTPGFYPAPPTVAPASTACAAGVSNGEGAVVVNIGTANRSSGVGTPNDSYGFFRFRVQIK